MHEHDAHASTAKSYCARPGAAATQAPFRKTFGRPHMQAIFDRYADPDSRERVFSPARDDRFDGDASDEQRQVVLQHGHSSER